MLSCPRLPVTGNHPLHNVSHTETGKFCVRSWKLASIEQFAKNIPFTEECYLGQGDKMMAKYEGSLLLLFQAINEAASAGCLAQGAQPTHHPF